MAKIENTTECLEALIDMMTKKGLSKLSYSDGEFEVKFSTESCHSVYSGSHLTLTDAKPIRNEEAPCAVAASGKIIKSPIVGTYYNTPAPDKAPFVTVGQKVKKGDVLMIIESMKLMNEITSDYDGTIAEIMVSNATAVEFDQPLMRIE